MSGETEVMVPFTIVPMHVLRPCLSGRSIKCLDRTLPACATRYTTRPKAKHPLFIGESAEIDREVESVYLPFLSSTVTVSFWHFIRNLRETVSRNCSILSEAIIPDELHICWF